MRRILLSFTLITYFITAYAQQREIRQLEQQIASHPQQDTFRVNRLNKLGQIPSISNGKVDTVATEALSIAQKLNYDIGKGFALVNKGLALLGTGKRELVPPILQ